MIYKDASPQDDIRKGWKEVMLIPDGQVEWFIWKNKWKPDKWVWDRRIGCWSCILRDSGGSHKGYLYSAQNIYSVVNSLNQFIKQHKK